MPEDARINFYSIQRCGYYRHGTSESIIGNISGLLSQLQSWATRDELPLGSTCTFSPQDTEDNLLRTFCFDIKSNVNTGDFFLTTWNETPSNEGKVPSVSSDRPVGEAQVHLNDIVEGTIPGYATYFWFIPQINVFATIKFQHLLNGQPNLVKYLNGFLETFSDHAVTTQTDDNNLTILGYREDINSEPQGLYHSFKSRLLRKAGEIEFIRQKHASIRKIIRKSQLDLEIEEERSLISKMLLKVGITKPGFK